MFLTVKDLFLKGERNTTERYTSDNDSTKYSYCLSDLWYLPSNLIVAYLTVVVSLRTIMVYFIRTLVKNTVYKTYRSEMGSGWHPFTSVLLNLSSLWDDGHEGCVLGHWCPRVTHTMLDNGKEECGLGFKIHKTLRRHLERPYLFKFMMIILCVTMYDM